MNFKFVLVGLALTISYASPTMAQVYQCVSQGRTTFTSIPGPGCTEVNLNQAPVSIIEPVNRNTDNQTNGSDIEPDSDRDQAKIAQARQELQDAQRALEEGKNIRLGGERNFVRFQERIQALQDVVDAKQKQLDQLLVQ